MRYVAEGPGWKLSGFLVDLGFERAEMGDNKVDTWNVGLGKYITEHTTLVADYEYQASTTVTVAALISTAAQLSHSSLWVMAALWHQPILAEAILANAKT
jgi:hypothetical protein